MPGFKQVIIEYKTVFWKIKVSYEKCLFMQNHNKNNPEDVTRTKMKPL